MPISASPNQDGPNRDRPSNREVEYENQRPAQGVDQDADRDGGRPPRPATEPVGAEGSSDSPKTRTDPGSGEA
jgi:hypothetical protein